MLLTPLKADDHLPTAPAAGSTSTAHARAGGRQHYVVARDQLLEFGTARQIEHRLAKGRLERVHEAVYRVAGSPETWHQQLLGACLASSGANAVSFRAAAQLWGLPCGAEVVEVAAPRHRRMQLEGVRIHESFYLTDLDVTYLHGIPVTRPARVICDLGLLVERGEIACERRSTSRSRTRCAATSSTSPASGASGSDSAASCGPAGASSRSC